MAHVKNNNRSKRKYGESRRAKTAANKGLRRTRHEERMNRLVQRAQKLIGRKVEVRTSEGPREAKVRDVLRPGDEGYPTDRKRGGTYFVVSDITNAIARSRIKPC